MPWLRWPVCTRRWWCHWYKVVAQDVLAKGGTLGPEVAGTNATAAAAAAAAAAVVEAEAVAAALLEGSLVTRERREAEEPEPELGLKPHIEL